jgi:adenosylcobinamide-GDP ribazoletransferase
MSQTPSTEQTKYQPGWAADFLIALVFLTRLPLRLSFQFDMSSVGRASRCFPLVGVVVGGLSGTVYYGAHSLNFPPLVAAFLALAVQVWLTGALHEDAFGDIADGFGGGIDKDKKMEIMRDSRVGTYAVIALILVIGMKAGAITAFDNPASGFAIILCAAVVSRAMLTFGLYLMPSARKDGLGASAGRPGIMVAIWALLFCLIIPVIILGPFTASIGIFAAMLAAAIMGIIAYRQIGGQTGDVLGSLQQVSETSFLIVLSAIIV